MFEKMHAVKPLTQSLSVDVNYSRSHVFWSSLKHELKLTNKSAIPQTFYKRILKKHPGWSNRSDDFFWTEWKRQLILALFLTIDKEPIQVNRNSIIRQYKFKSHAGVVVMVIFDRYIWSQIIKSTWTYEIWKVQEVLFSGIYKVIDISL